LYKSGINMGIDGIVYVKQFYEDSGNTQHRFLVHAKNKKVYINQMFSQSYDMYWLYGLTFDSAPISLSFKKDGQDAVILASENEMKIWKTGYSPYDIPNAPIITSMCVNDGVLFCTIKQPAFKIWYATDLDAENVGNISNTSGYISLEDSLGNAGKVITFNQDVYVFREFGISKINFNKKEISVNQVYESSTRIFTNTVSVCENSILFMTREGLCVFNGVKVKKMELSIPKMEILQNLTATACSLEGKYYVSFPLNFNDNKKILCEGDAYCKNNTLLIVDTDDFSYEVIRGVDIKSFVPMKNEYFEKMMVVYNSIDINCLSNISSENSGIFERILERYWESNYLAEDANLKVFTKLRVKADKDVQFNISFDDTTLSLTTYKSGVNEFFFKVYSKDIKITIISKAKNSKVEEVVFDYYEE